MRPLRSRAEGEVSHDVFISHSSQDAAFTSDVRATTARIIAARENFVRLFFLVQFIQCLVYEIPLFRVAIVDFRLASRDPLRNANNRRLRRIGNPERTGNLFQLREQLIGQYQLNSLSRHPQLVIQMTFTI